MSDDRYFLFFNQKTSPGNELEMAGPRGEDGEIFALKLNRLPSSIQRLVFTAAIDGAGSMSHLGMSYWQLFAGGHVAATFAFEGRDFGAEKAIMIAEFYRKDGSWRVAAIGQGFNGGMSALLKHFGGKETPSAPPKPAPAPPPPRSAPPPLPTPLPVRLTKITLDKPGERKVVNLNKGGGLQPIAVNLNWGKPAGAAPAPKSGGLFSGFGGGGSAASERMGADLDLGCMVLMRDGTKLVIQPIGGYFGSRTESPFIFLDKDDRTGAAQDGENLTIFRPDLINRVLIFAFIYEGVSNFSHVNARLTLREQDGSETLIQLNNPDSSKGFCAICLIRHTGGGVEIVKEERYFAGHRYADEQYGFGFQWTRGSK